jgi:hypothetical protein
MYINHLLIVAILGPASFCPIKLAKAGSLEVNYLLLCPPFVLTCAFVIRLLVLFLLIIPFLF